MGRTMKFFCYLTFVLQIIIEIISLAFRGILLYHCLCLREFPFRLKRIKYYLLIKLYINIAQDFIGLIAVSFGLYSFYFKISQKLLVFII